jgi:hypothetical protein
VYEDFIKNEKEFSIRFLKSQQILPDRFDEDEYLVIKELFKNVSMIEKIYEVIDYILKKEKIYNISKIIVMGDFLFSMGYLNSKDPVSLVLKISRDDYLSNIELRANINKWFGYNHDIYIKIHKKLLIGLRDEKIIEKNIIKVKNEKWETIIYFKIIFKINNLEDIHPLGLSKFPFIVNLSKEYSIGSFRNIWKLKRKKREMEDYPICINSVIKANSIKLKLNKNIYEINKKILDKEMNSILNKSNCSSVKDYFDKLKRIVDDKEYSKALNFGKEIYGEIYVKNLISIRINIKEEYAKIIKNFQKVMTMNMINRNIFNIEYYLPCFIDNRGRQYYGTLLSPTFYKIFRNMYCFVEEKEFVDLEKSTFYKKIIKHKKLVESFNLNDLESYVAIVLLIEIGKNFIEIKNECFIKTEDIIKLGILNINKTKELDFEEEMYVNKIRCELIKLIKKDKVDINTLIFKDATASGLQNYGILLKYKKEMLKYLNIDGDDWCDTYQHIVNKFINDEEFKKRKYWKSTIMTIPYNAVWYSCFTKFIEKLEQNGIIYKEMSEERKEYIKNMHRSFYYEVKSNIKNEFFVNNEADLIEFKYKEWKLSNKKEYKINYKKLREKYSVNYYELIEDTISTERSKEANNMHYLDALLVKEIIEFFDIISIHDCFGIRLCELHLVMDKINKYYSEKVDMDTYNIHIIK